MENMICASVNCDFFMAMRFLHCITIAQFSTLPPSGFLGRSPVVVRKALVAGEVVEDRHGEQLRVAYPGAVGDSGLELRLAAFPLLEGQAEMVYRQE